MDAFQKKVEDLLEDIGLENLGYCESESWMYDEQYHAIENYVYSRKFLNTALALPIVRSLHDGTYRGFKVTEDGLKCRRPYFCHCLSVCQMLINLHLPLTEEEEDITLAAALCHDLMVYLPFPEHGEEMTAKYHMHPRIGQIMGLIYEGNCTISSDYDALFERVQQDKLALLVRLSDRGNIVEELYNVSTWKAHEYIHDTRIHYLSMCIYAREHYPELDTVVGILQEKIRELTEATEIFVTRYENREKELTNRILALKEENARMRTLIRRRKAEMEG